MINKIKSLPIPVKDLIEAKYTLSFFSNEQCKYGQEKGFSIPFGDSFIIFINSDLPDGMDNFTLAHELAHLVLKHHDEYDIDNLTNRELWILDREADIFAACLLMPESLVKENINDKLSIAEIGRLKCEFAVSWQAIINRLDELKICSKAMTQEMFLRWRDSKKKDAAYYQQEFNYCTSIRIPEKRIISVEQFRIPEVDDKLRFVFCPACGNDDISSDAHYCKKCGEYLYNLCTNTNGSRMRCGERNVSDALYCEYCGAQTTLKQLIDRVHSYDEIAATKKRN
jgi:Predicted Zn peptidase